MNSMAVPDLSLDELLSITRSVRKRLDLTRPLEAEVIEQCLSLALQAPTAGAQEHWHFVVVTDPTQRSALAALCLPLLESLLHLVGWGEKHFSKPWLCRGVQKAWRCG
jgi:nitroreductase